MSMRRVSSVTVAHALGEWRTFEGPLFRRLAGGIASAIQRGDLPAGGLLPADRRLAAALGVARGTVVAAYELLRSDGVIERRHGSGTWITAPHPVAFTADGAMAVRAGRLIGRMLGAGADVIDLGVSILPDAGALPDAALHLDAGDLERLAAGHGYQPAGLHALRHRLARLHTETGLPTAAGQVVVTTGGQQAIDLVARLLVRAGDPVLVERPTYPGAIETFARLGARTVGVDVDGAGVRVDDLVDAAERERPRLVYVVATCHNPTGAVMPEGRRRVLAGLADRDVPVVEDASVAHLTFAGPPPPPVAAFARTDAPAITIGSLSKLLWGGLRIGWVRAPQPLAMRLGRLKASMDIGSSAVAQAVALRALDAYDTIVDDLRARHAERAGVLCGLLAEQLPGWRFDPPAGGLSMWVELPSGSADAFAPHAAQHGVVFLPGGAASVDDAHPRHLRLSFALPPEQLVEGVRRLRAAWADYVGMGFSAAAAG